jgi:hypothetical protein
MAPPPMIRDKGMIPAKKFRNAGKNSARQKIPRITAIKPPMIFFMRTPFRLNV